MSAIEFDPEKGVGHDVRDERVPEPEPDHVPAEPVEWKDKEDE